MSFVAEIDCGELEPQAESLGAFEGARKGFAVRCITKNSGDEGEIGGVTLAGRGEGAVQREADMRRDIVEETAGGKTNARSSGGVRTGGSHHDGSNDVEGG